MYEQFDFDSKPRRETLEMIEQADAILMEYKQNRWATPTLRQLYYQFVSRDLFANTMANYNKLVRNVSLGRLMGSIDWTHLVDRERPKRGNYRWKSIEAMLNYFAGEYTPDLWAYQDVRVEVWIEKNALIGTIQGVCLHNGVDYMSCKGYASQTMLYEAAERVREADDEGKRLIILHLGDHDPSGIDMTRDIEARVSMFAERDVEVRRIALNMDQVREHNPPPNPAKETDARFEDYARVYGYECWELDALNQDIIARLVRKELKELRREEDFQQAIRERDIAIAAAKEVLENLNG